MALDRKIKKEVITNLVKEAEKHIGNLERFCHNTGTPFNRGDLRLPKDKLINKLMQERMFYVRGE